MTPPSIEDRRANWGFSIRWTFAIAMLLLAANLFACVWTNMLVLFGGPTFWYGQFVITAIAIPVAFLVLLICPRPKLHLALLIGGGLWSASCLGLLMYADFGLQSQWYAKQGGLLAESGAAPLPEGCRMGARMPGAVNLFFAECDQSVAEVAAIYRKRLGPDWNETPKRGTVRFDHDGRYRGFRVMPSIYRKETWILLEEILDCAPDTDGCADR